MVFCTPSSEMRDRISRVAGLTGCLTVVPTWFRIFFQRPSLSESLKSIYNPFPTNDRVVRVLPSLILTLFTLSRNHVVIRYADVASSGKCSPSRAPPRNISYVARAAFQGTSLFGDLRCAPTPVLPEFRDPPDVICGGCAISAPSGLAVDVPWEFGMTLIGFLRGGRFNLYAGSDRIRLENSNGRPG